MQLSGPTVIVEAERRVRLLLRLNQDRSRAERVYGSSGNVDDLAGEDVGPVEQFFRALLVNRFFKL